MSEDFKYLGGNPGLSQTDVPFLDNLDVQKTATRFNYSVWGAETKLYLKHVPAAWDSEYLNVVQFESKSQRDAYFKTNPPVTLDTEFRISHDGVVRLPIPYDNLIDYNYLVAEYPNAPVPGYNGNTARKQYFYFIRDCKYIAPNTTELEIELDVWTTYLDDIEISSMQLDRGHYAMTLTDVNDYLANPLTHRIGLGTVDVNFGSLSRIPKDHSFNIIGTVFYVIATTSNPKTFTEITTVFNSGNNPFHKGLYYFAVKESDWMTFVTNTTANTPNFFQTIKAIMVIPSTMLAINESSVFTFNSTSCYDDIQSNFNINYTFTKADFGYSHEYDWITKLYTAPYAMVEFIDFDGQAQQVPFEDLYVGKFAMQMFVNLSIANPGARIVLLNVCGSGLNSEFNTHAIDVPFPTMNVNLNPTIKYMFETKYPRVQQQNDINTAYNNATDSASVGKTNADAAALASKNNSIDSADSAKTIGENNRDQVDSFYADDGTMIGVQANNDILMNKKMSDIQAHMNMDNAYANLVTIRQKGKAGFRNATFSWAQNVVSAAGGAAVGSAGGLVNGIMGCSNAIVDAMEGGIELGVAMGLLRLNVENTLLDAAYINGSQGKTYTIPADYVPSPGEDVTAGIKVTVPKQEGIINEHGWHRAQDAMALNNSKRTKAYDTATANIGESHDTSVGNTNRSYNTAVAANLRSYNLALRIAAAIKANGEAAIQNAINQSRLGDNAMYGTPGDHSKWANGLMAVRYHIKTQSEDAIRKAGDYFLRYGYAFGGNCDFTSFNLMRYFTFWKCSEVWLASDKITGKVASKFKEILSRGVTVWRDPATMGNVSIYDNTVGGGL